MKGNRSTASTQSGSVVSLLNQATAPKVDFTTKEGLVEELAARWWYALPPWPPADFDFE